MVIIGVTGGICSGKSTVTKILESFGASIIDADKLGHAAYEPGSSCYFKLIEAFGDSIVSIDELRSINRKALGDIVFRDVDLMKLLQSIVWPEIRKLIIQHIQDFQARGKDHIVIEAAVMIEAGWQDLMDVLWVVEVDREVAIARLIARNSLSAEQAESRLMAQLSNEKRRLYATSIIINTGNHDDLAKVVTDLWGKLASPSS